MGAVDPITNATRSELSASVRIVERAASGLAAPRCCGIRVGVAGAGVQIELVDLADEIDPKAVMALLIYEVKPAVHVDLPSSDQRVVGPQLHPRVASSAGESDALIDQAMAEASAARRRLDQQDAQLRGGVVGRDAENTAHPPTTHLSDPCGLAPRARIGSVVGNNPRHQRFEIGVPAEFRGVLLPMGHHHPAEVAGATKQSDPDFLFGQTISPD